MPTRMRLHVPNPDEQCASQLRFHAGGIDVLKTAFNPEHLSETVRLLSILL